MSSWTESDLTAIEAALARGELSVRYEDKQVTYRSVDEMLRIREMIAGSLRSSTAQPSSAFGGRRTYIGSDRGTA